MEKYDCTNDVLKHRERVAYWLKWLTVEVLDYRASVHDESKLHSPEKEIFDEFTPKLKTLDFGSDEYKTALEKMGEGLKHHYKVNPHHPESHRRGVDGMTIWDLLEMLADWMAAASVKSANIDLGYLQKRFNLSQQLKSIIANTLWCADMDAINCKIQPEYQQISNFVSGDPIVGDAAVPDVEACPVKQYHDDFADGGHNFCYECGVRLHRR